MLDRILMHLEAEDVGALRLVATAFSDHPAFLNLCTSTGLNIGLSSRQVQAALGFLRLLPRLQQLHLIEPRSLHGVQQLTQLSELNIHGCPSVLDLMPLGQLPQLTSLILFDCPAAQMGNLSELSQLIKLSVSRESLHPQVSLLTALKVLKIEPDEDESDGFCATLYSSLTGLTRLCHDISGSQVWHRMPCLQALEVTDCPTSLQGIAAVTTLRALHLDTNNLPSPTSLAPWSALIHLERLLLSGRTLALPALTAMTRLTLETNLPHQTFPATAGLPSLKELHVELYGMMHLPDLSVLLPQLSRIVISDDGLCDSRFAGRLTLNALEAHKFSIERRSHLLDIDQDEY